MTPLTAKVRNPSSCGLYCISLVGVRQPLVSRERSSHKFDSPLATPDPESVHRAVPPSADQLRELEILIRAHHPLLLVDTVEEERVHVLLEHAAEHIGLPIFSWTQVDGLRRELLLELRNCAERLIS